MSLNRNVARSIRDWVALWPDEPDEGMLFRVLRYLGQWRSIMLANTFLRQHGPRVLGGVFEGMEYVSVTTEGALIPRLLGTYESELHPYLLSMVQEPPDEVIDIGCADGYYAVGLARLFPTARVHAFDIDPKAQTACAALAARNGVAARVVVGGEFPPEGFQAFAGRRTLVLVDAEGAEFDILRPELAPALRDMELVVETHDVHRAGVLAALLERFAPTHDIIRVDGGPKQFKAPDWLANLSQLDQLLAVWEWRLRPTPWLIMTPKRCA